MKKRINEIRDFNIYIYLIDISARYIQISENVLYMNRKTITVRKIEISEISAELFM